MMRYWNENWWCGPGNYFHGPFAMFINLAFWVGLVLLVVWLLRAFTSSSGSQTGSSAAIEILKRRYANGEIDTEEFEQIIQDLRKS